MIVKSVVPQLCDINLASNKELLKKYSNYLDIFSNFVDEVQVALDYRDTFFKNDTVNARIEFFKGLENRFKNFDNDFISYWHSVFNSSPHYIKSKVSNKLLNFNTDSLGKYSNSTYILDDNVLPVLDTSFNRSPIPTYLPYNAINKVSPYYKKLFERASYRVNNMYRNNIALVQPANAKPQDAHGQNLVTDSQYYEIFSSQIKNEIFNTIKTTFQNEIKIISYYCNLNDDEAVNYQDTDSNQQFVGPIEIELDIENVRVKVDVLSNKIKYIKSKLINDEILSTEKIETINLKAKTTEEQDRLYRNNILTRLENYQKGSILSKIFQSSKQTSETQSNDAIQDSVYEPDIEDKTNSQAAQEIIPEFKAPANVNSQLFPTNTLYPTYNAPEWAKGIASCLGMGSVLDVFAGVEDPLTITDNLLNSDFNLFGELSKINPFGINFGGFAPFGFSMNLIDLSNIDISNLSLQVTQSFDNLLNQINSFDLTSVAGLFGANIPIPSFTLGSLFDTGNIREMAMKTAQDQLLNTLQGLLTQSLQNLACGAAQGGIAGSISNPLGGLGI
jgi:hypothetical protein